MCFISLGRFNYSSKLMKDGLDDCKNGQFGNIFVFPDFLLNAKLGKSHKIACQDMRETIHMY